MGKNNDIITSTKIAVKDNSGRQPPSKITQLKYKLI